MYVRIGLLARGFEYSFGNVSHNSKMVCNAALRMTVNVQDHVS